MTGHEGLRALAEVATPGPWRSWVEGRDGFGGDDAVLAPGIDIYVNSTSGGVANQDFIAAANPAVVLGLLDRLEATEARVAAVRELVPAWEEAAEAIRENADDNEEAFAVADVLESRAAHLTRALNTPPEPHNRGGSHAH